MWNLIAQHIIPLVIIAGMIVGCLAWAALEGALRTLDSIMRPNRSDPEYQAEMARIALERESR
jgi:hypothetical protein